MWILGLDKLKANAYSSMFKISSETVDVKNWVGAEYILYQNIHGFSSKEEVLKTIKTML